MGRQTRGGTPFCPGRRIHKGNSVKTILVSGVGGPTPRSFAIALRNHSRFSRYRFIATDCDRYAVGLYQDHLFNKSYLIPGATDPAYWSAIEAVVQEEDIGIAVVLPEIEALEWSRRSVNASLPCKALIPDFKLASQLVDKAVMTELLLPSGLVPRSFAFLRDELDYAANFEIPYPFWVRSAEGSSGLGSFLVKSAEELENWTLLNPEVRKFLASEFLPGRNLACKLLYFKGELVRSAVGERVELHHGQGVPLRHYREHFVWEIAKRPGSIHHREECDGRAF